MGMYPLVNVNKKLWKITMFNGKNSLFLWPFSIAMLVYQRVIGSGYILWICWQHYNIGDMLGDRMRIECLYIYLISCNIVNIS